MIKGELRNIGHSHKNAFDLEEINLTPTEEETLFHILFYKGKDDMLVNPSKNQIQRYGHFPFGEKYSLNYMRKNIKSSTPDLISDNGWLVKEHIEYLSKENIQKPYMWNKRWDILDGIPKDKISNSRYGLANKGLVKISDYTYTNKRKQTSSETVYRVIRDTKIFLRIFMYFVDKKDYKWKFIKSDYYKDMKYVFEELFVSNLPKRKPLNIDTKDKSMMRMNLYLHLGNFREYSKIIPPSLIEWLLKDKQWPNIPKGEYKLTIRQLFVTFVIMDYINCNDPELKKEFSKLLDGIDKHNKEAMGPKSKVIGRAFKYVYK